MTEPRSLLNSIQIVLYKHNAVKYTSKLFKPEYNETEYQEASEFIHGYRWSEPTLGPVQEAVNALLEATRDLDRPKRVEWRRHVFRWLTREQHYIIERADSAECLGSADTVVEAKELVILHYRAIAAAANITLRELEKPE